MDFIIFIACTAALIGGLGDDKKAKGFEGWELKNKCEVRHEGAVLGTIVIECKNGEKFILPAAHCSISYLKKEK